jgi:DNA-binding MarR family transcriptional regulator
MEKMTMDFTKADSVIPLFEKVMNRYIATEKRSFDYDVGCLLYRSEIHTIDAIGKHNNINVTELSNYLGITKSAVSQMIDKLSKKGMVTKTVLSKSDTRVALALTSSGKKVYNAHNEHHRNLYRYMEQALATVTESDIDVYVSIMNQLYTLLDE